MVSISNFSSGSAAEASFNRTLVMRIKSDGYLDYTGFELDNPPRYVPYEFEKLDWKGWVVYNHRNWYFPVYAGIIYIALIFGIQIYMRNRKAFDLRRELFLWNAVLGIFSIIGFVRMAPEFFGVLMEAEGFFKSVCVWQGGNMPTAFWGVAFILSKYVELGDTVFIVLRKRPLQFLQWYHHIITLAVCWITSPYVEPISRYYVVMNYGVHSLMYPYFALKALDVKIPRYVANVITTLQLSQMLIGLGVNTYSGVLNHIGGAGACYRHPSSVKMFFVVYGSFAILFGELFYKLVVKTHAKSKQG